jgi:riboflavin-specific deaminase-like protein
VLVVGHLGQSLDGFIATESGDSRFVTGPDNIVHLHRMRALCDAVIVGAGTVAADDPQLTTREVPGPHPLRVVLDPRRRLDAPGACSPIARAHAAGACGAGRRPRRRVASRRWRCRPVPDGLDLAALVAALQARGCRRLFVEGGARTVAGFLQAGLLSRLQIAVAPLLIGAGRPTIRLPGSLSLSDCLRARHRVFRMGTRRAVRPRPRAAPRRRHALRRDARPAAGGLSAGVESAPGGSPPTSPRGRRSAASGRVAGAASGAAASRRPAAPRPGRSRARPAPSPRAARPAAPASSTPIRQSLRARRRR